MAEPPAVRGSGWRFEAEMQNAQTHSSGVAEIAGLQPLTSNIIEEL